MAKIYNSDLTKGIANNACIQQNFDKVPNELAEKVVPVMESNPELLRKTNLFLSGTSSVSGQIFLGTTSSTKDTYISSVHFGLIKDAACDVGSSSLAILSTKDGATVSLARIPVLTLTAQQNDVSVYFKEPIKLDRSANITSNMTYAAGLCSRNCLIFGYTIDNPNA